MNGTWSHQSRKFSIWSAAAALTLGLLTACGSGDDDVASTPTTPTTPPAVVLPSSVASISATETPETTKSVTLYWSAPADGPAVDSYNIYRSTSPNVASDLASATKIEDVTSPYVDIVPEGQVTYYYVVTAVNEDGEGAPSAEVSATPKGPKGGGHTSTFGNNLSVPLVFADGLGVTGGVITGTDHTDLATGLRPTATDITSPFPYLNPLDVVTVDGVDYYTQQSSSTWQANWKNARLDGMQSVFVDWGDNLTSASLRSTQRVIRVETNLLQDKGVPAAEGLTPSWPDTESMLAYPMTLLGGQGINEMQGTTGATFEATRRRVFAVNARLKIQKLVDGVPQDHVCGFNGSIAEGFALPDSSLVKYSSEINVAGAITYGFNWRLGACTSQDKTGAWRLTFSLDDVATVNGVDYPNNVSLDGLDASETNSVLVDSKTTYIDINVK